MNDRRMDMAQLMRVHVFATAIACTHVGPSNRQHRDLLHTQQVSGGSMDGRREAKEQGCG